MRIPATLSPVLLLIASNVFMTFAWYLSDQEGGDQARQEGAAASELGHASKGGSK